MKRIIQYTLLLAFILPAITAFGQNKLDKANKLFCKLAYDEALELYLEVINDNEDVDPDAYFKVALCYADVDKPEESVKWFARSVNYESNSPLDYLYYAQSLQQNERYEEASEWYGRYNEVEADDSRGWRGMMACDNYMKLKENQKFVVENAVKINSSASDITPAFFNGQLIFSSDREVEKYSKKEFDWTGGYFYNNFEVEEKSRGKLGSPKVMDSDVNSQYHDGTAALSADGTLMTFARTHDEKKAIKDDCPGKVVYNLKLVSSNYNTESKKWGEPTDKPFVNINDKDYIVAHPSLSSDGKRLYFTSDNPNFDGAQGTSDIYMSTFENGVWSEPVNLGETMNTEGQEEFPYVYNDSLLFFSSNANLGDGGLGGFDIYHVEIDKETGKPIAKPKNMGWPINSPRDDFAFIIREDDGGIEYGYFASSRTTKYNKNAKGKDDIYYWMPELPIYLKITAKDDCVEAPIMGAQLEIQSDDKLLATAETDENGVFFSDTLITANTNYSVYAKYEDQQLNQAFHSYGKKGGDTVMVDLVFRGTLKVQGFVYNTETTKPLVGAEVGIVDAKTGTSIKRVETDDKGFYSIKLMPDKEYLVIGYKLGYESDTVSFSTAGMRCEIISEDLYLNPGRQFLTNVYYYFDKAYIYRYTEALEDLDDLVEFLNENPSFNIEIRSHTDSRASFKYNEALGQRRAQSVKDYLIDDGIGASRLTPISYGEYCTLNGCDDGVPCNEVQHQRNRRTEVLVLNNPGGKTIKTREKEKWTSDEDFYVEGGKYFEEGKGSNWQDEEDFQGKHGNWKNIPIRKDCDINQADFDYSYQVPSEETTEEIVEEKMSAPKAEDVVEPTKEETPAADKTTSMSPSTGTVYKIQFAASTSSDEVYQDVEGLGNIQIESTGPYYRYLVGEYGSEQEAIEHLKELKEQGFKAAYVVPYENGNRKK